MYCVGETIEITRPDSKYKFLYDYSQGGTCERVLFGKWKE